MSAYEWKTFLNDIAKYGFEIIEQQKVTVPDNEGPITNLIAAHRTNFLLLHAVSYQRKKEILDYALMYGYMNSGGINKLSRDNTKPILGHGQTTANPVYFSILIKPGVLAQLKEFSKDLAFTKWPAPHPLANITETSIEARSVREAGWAAFCKSAPSWVKDFIK